VLFFSITITCNDFESIIYSKTSLQNLCFHCVVPRARTKLYFLHSFLLSLLIFFITFDRLFYLKYLFKYIVL
jgi:hypothetical protein